MTGICVAAISAVALQGCASSGTVATAGPGTATGTSTGAPGTGTSTGAPSSTAAVVTTESSAGSAPASTSATVSPPAGGTWTPQGQLANPEPIEEVLNADKSVTATWPKGAAAGHALTIKMRAARNGGKIVIHLAIDNTSGKKVTMNEGVFTGGAVLDAQGNDLNEENFDPLWTLGSGSADGNIDPGQPLVGDFVVDAPASGSVLNAYWTQAVASDNGIMAGIILIRNIPIN